MSRLHPFDYVFGAVADDWFAGIRDEAGRGGRDPSDLAQFAKLAAVQRIMGKFQTPEPDQSPQAQEEYLHLLFAGFRFWHQGRHTLELSREAIERAVRDRALAAPRAVPQDACYVWLPERAFWSQLAAGAPHEPLDGLFLVSGRRGRELLVLGVLGLRAERGGFSQITASAVMEDLVAAAAAAAAHRSPFEPAMDGGRAAGFRSVTSVAELLLLAHLALVHARE